MKIKICQRTQTFNSEWEIDVGNDPVNNIDRFGLCANEPSTKDELREIVRNILGENRLDLYTENERQNKENNVTTEKILDDGYSYIPIITDIIDYVKKKKKERNIDPFRTTYKWGMDMPTILRLWGLGGKPEVWATIDQDGYSPPDSDIIEKKTLDIPVTEYDPDTKAPIGTQVNTIELNPTNDSAAEGVALLAKGFSDCVKVLCMNAELETITIYREKVDGQWYYNVEAAIKDHLTDSGVLVMTKRILTEYEFITYYPEFIKKVLAKEGE